MTKNLPRTIQCAKCPWKVNTNPREIPDGYCEKKHAALATTIAKEGELDFNKPAMACHHSSGNDEMYCIGWLHNQLGAGNNIPLRIRMLHYSNANKIQVFGPQHETFNDTLPADLK